jgi:hypothetical protein
MATRVVTIINSTQAEPFSARAEARAIGRAVARAMIRRLISHAPDCQLTLTETTNEPKRIWALGASIFTADGSILAEISIVVAPGPTSDATLTTFASLATVQRTEGRRSLTGQQNLSLFDIHTCLLDCLAGRAFLQADSRIEQLP